MRKSQEQIVELQRGDDKAFRYRCMRNGQFIEFTDSRPMCYHLRLTAVAGSVPCSATTFLANLFLGSPFHFWPSSKPRAAFRRSPCADLAPWQAISGGFCRPFRLSIALVSQRIAPNCSEPAHAETHIRQRVVRASSKQRSSPTLVLMRAAKSQTATHAFFSET